MADTWTKAKRSEVMSLVRGKGNKSTELLMASLLRKAHITGWRRHLPIPGRPDFAFKSKKLALFIDGCFWHGCPIHGRRPKSNRAFWDQKIDLNIHRDKKISAELQRLGWHVLRIWEHEVGEAAIELLAQFDLTPVRLKTRTKPLPLRTLKAP